LHSSEPFKDDNVRLGSGIELDPDQSPRQQKSDFVRKRRGTSLLGHLHASGLPAAAVPVGNLIRPATEAESRITAGEDKTYDTADHVANLRAINVTPHVTQNRAVIKTGKNRNSAIAGKDMRCA
jgi:hypothetical protein